MSPDPWQLIGTFALLAFAEAWTYTVIFFGAGVLLALSEVFIPSGGILAGCSIVTFITALVFAFLWHPIAGAVALVLIAILVPLSIRTLIKVVPKMHATRDLVLEAEGEKVVVEATGGPSEVDEHASLNVGMRGEALRPLRPSGAVRFEGRRVDCVGQGGFIEKGAAVEIVELEGPRVVVRRAD